MDYYLQEGARAETLSANMRRARGPVGAEIPGTRKMLENGVLAAFFNSPSGTGRVFKIIGYPTDVSAAERKNMINESMSAARKAKKDAGIGRYSRPIAPKTAKAAWNKYRASRLASVGNDKRRRRGVFSAMGRDLQYTSSPRVHRTTTAYLLNPGKYEYPGVDMGTKKYKPRTQTQLAALARNRAIRAAKYGYATSGATRPRASPRKASPKASPAAAFDCSQYTGQANCAANPACGWTVGRGGRGGRCDAW
jgi:hypothetical protein